MADRLPQESRKPLSSLFSASKNNDFPSNDKDKSSSTTDTKYCRLCFENGAVKRQCCNAFYCDHCYIKNQKCPNCGVQTKQEALTGATYQLKLFSEHEECRVCLDPGSLRRCCGNYYCDDCYYKVPTCRSCGSIVSSIRDEKLMKQQKGALFGLIEDRTRAYSVFLSWVLTFFLVLSTLTFFSIIAAAEIEAPVGINSYTCYGFFRKCDIDLCINLNNSVALGIDPLPPLSTYSPCTLESTTKMQNLACIYDNNLYHQSNTQLGYDICEEEFENGIYIFEDTFEYWQNLSHTSNYMKSAKWSGIDGGFTNTYCGSFEGKKSLSFRGIEKRKAESQDLNLMTGGRIDAYLFLPPISNELTNPYCRPGFVGVINVDYSINGGKNWTTITTYEPALWRQHKFFRILVEFPKESWTNATRFRFFQPIFNEIQDNWALDKVRILKNLPNKWHSSTSFVNNVHKAQKEIQYAQCCSDTDWCEKRLTVEERANCPSSFQWYTKESYLFRLAEIIICIVFLLNVIKFIYLSIMNYLIHGYYPFHEEFLIFINLQWISSLLKKLPMSFRIYFTMLINSWNNGESAAVGSIDGDKNYTMNESIQHIHLSARYQEQNRQDIDDLEGQGIMLKSKEEIENEKIEYYKKIKKQKKKLAKRMKKKNFKGSTIVIEEDQHYLDQLENNVLPIRDDNNNIVNNTSSPSHFPKDLTGNENDIPLYETNDEEIKYDVNSMSMIEDIILNNVDRLRRQNMAMLRIPFEFDDLPLFRFYFNFFLYSILTLLFFLEFGLSISFSIYQPINLFGIYTTTLFMNSYVLTITAGICDLKEIYFISKTIVPISSSFFPYITIDLTEDNRCLFIDYHRIPLSDISDITAFPISFLYLNLLGIIFGCFPYCLFSLLIREAFLTYTTMRFITPFIGSIMIIRAVLGPMFLIKAVFVLQYIFSAHFDIRETIGKAIQKQSSYHLSINVALGLMILGIFFTALTSIENVPYIIVAGLCGGWIFGLLTGTAHELPIKPWMCKSYSVLSITFLLPLSLLFCSSWLLLFFFCSLF
jgi:hypothetical protein